MRVVEDMVLIDFGDNGGVGVTCRWRFFFRLFVDFVVDVVALERLVGVARCDAVVVGCDSVARCNSVVVGCDSVVRCESVVVGCDSVARCESVVVGCAVLVVSPFARSIGLGKNATELMSPASAWSLLIDWLASVSLGV